MMFLLRRFSQLGMMNDNVMLSYCRYWHLVVIGEPAKVRTAESGSTTVIAEVWLAENFGVLACLMRIRKVA